MLDHAFAASPATVDESLRLAYALGALRLQQAMFGGSASDDANAAALVIPMLIRAALVIALVVMIVLVLRLVVLTLLVPIARRCWCVMRC